MPIRLLVNGIFFLFLCNVVNSSAPHEDSKNTTIIIPANSNTLHISATLALGGQIGLNTPISVHSNEQIVPTNGSSLLQATQNFVQEHLGAFLNFVHTNNYSQEFMQHVRDNNYHPKALILPGGGTRGIISVYQLAFIKKQTNKPIMELFDVISGVSTGAIIALLLGIGKPIEEIISLYIKISKLVFSQKGDGVKYSSEPLAKIAVDIFANKTLRDLDDRAVIILPYFDLEKQRIGIYNSYMARKKSWMYDVSLVQIILSTTAAIWFFAPQKVANGWPSVLSKIIPGQKNLLQFYKYCIDEHEQSIIKASKNVAKRYDNSENILPNSFLIELDPNQATTPMEEVVIEPYLSKNDTLAKLRSYLQKLQQKAQQITHFLNVGEPMDHVIDVGIIMNNPGVLVLQLMDKEIFPNIPLNNLRMVILGTGRPKVECAFLQAAQLDWLNVIQNKITLLTELVYLIMTGQDILTQNVIAIQMQHGANEERKYYYLQPSIPNIHLDNHHAIHSLIRITQNFISINANLYDELTSMLQKYSEKAPPYQKSKKHLHFS